MKRAHKPFDLQAALASNPTLRRLNPPKTDVSTVLEAFFDKKGIKSPPKPQEASLLLKRHRKQGQVRALTNRFLAAWRLLGGPELEAEFRFHPTRKFRADYAYLPRKALIEISGNTWTVGGHSTGTGIRRDYIKMNLAQMQGYRVFQFTADMIREPSEFILPVIQFLNEPKIPVWSPMTTI